MTNAVTGTVRSLSDEVAEEIRVLLTRRRMSQRRMAQALGVSPAWLNYRLTGVQAIDLNDLERIADVLGVTVIDLLPSAKVRPNNRSTDLPVRMMSPTRPVSNRPKRGPSNGSTRPVSPVPPARRRPTEARATP